MLHRRHLVVRSQPRAGGQRDDIIGVIVEEHLGVRDCQLVQGTPDPVVGTGLGVVIAGHQTGRPLRAEHLAERVRRPVDDRAVKGALEDRNPGSVHQRAGDLGPGSRSPGPRLGATVAPKRQLFEVRN